MAWLGQNYGMESSLMKQALDETDVMPHLSWLVLWGLTLQKVIVQLIRILRGNDHHLSSLPHLLYNILLHCTQWGKILNMLANYLIYIYGVLCSIKKHFLFCCFMFENPPDFFWKSSFQNGVKKNICESSPLYWVGYHNKLKSIAKSLHHCAALHLPQYG